MSAFVEGENEVKLNWWAFVNEVKKYGLEIDREEVNQVINGER
jgi:hypothetical protein